MTAAPPPPLPSAASMVSLSASAMVPAGSPAGSLGALPEALPLGGAPPPSSPIDDSPLLLEPELLNVGPGDDLGRGAAASPISALKELVARLNREQYKIQDLLSSLGYALRSFKNINQFLELIPLIATRVTDADGGALLLFRPNGQIRLDHLHCQEFASDRCDPHAVRRAFEWASRETGRALTDNRASRKEDPYRFEEAAIAQLDARIAQALGCEVRVFGASIWVNEADRGRLYTFSCAPDFGWTAKRQKLVRLVADQTAVAIENDEMTVQLRQKERLDREMEIGAEIQLRLLPRHAPVVEGVDFAARCQPADRVGGDYYDFIPVDRARFGSIRAASGRGRSSDPASGPWGVAIGDVMGKGVPAGLIMTMTRGMLRAEVLNGHTPARILQHLNRVMYADLENSHRFVTLFYSEFDPKTQRLGYSNAAHNPPLLWQASSDQVLPLDANGMLIGLDADSHYEDAQIQLGAGDVVMYYTDGFTDAADPRGDRFEENRLRETFYHACHTCTSAQAILDALFDRLSEFIGSDGRNEDDMTAIILRVDGD